MRQTQGFCPGRAWHLLGAEEPWLELQEEDAPLGVEGSQADSRGGEGWQGGSGVFSEDVTPLGRGLTEQRSAVNAQVWIFVLIPRRLSRSKFLNLSTPW